MIPWPASRSPATRWLAVLAFSLITAACTTDEAATDGSTVDLLSLGPTVVDNAEVYTLDDDQPWVDAFADLETALALATIEAAWALGHDRATGSIEEGQVR